MPDQRKGSRCVPSPSDSWSSGTTIVCGSARSRRHNGRARTRASRRRGSSRTCSKCSQLSERVRRGRQSGFAAAENLREVEFCEAHERRVTGFHRMQADLQGSGRAGARTRRAEFETWSNRCRSGRRRKLWQAGTRQMRRSSGRLYSRLDWHILRSGLAQRIVIVPCLSRIDPKVSHTETWVRDVNTWHCSILCA